MISFISGFNKLWIVAAILLVVSVNYFFICFSSSTNISYKFRKMIDEEKPDMILLGSSAAERISIGSLEMELQSLTHKKYKILPWFQVKTGADYWQLVLENQVASARHKNFVVGIMCATDALTRANNTMMSEEVLSQLGNREEPSHYRKELGAMKTSWEQGVLRKWKMYSFKGRGFFNFFVHFFVEKINPSLDVGHVFKEQRMSYENNKGYTNYTLSLRSPDDFDKALNTSYLPDIVALTKANDLGLFVVILPTAVQANHMMREYFSKLKDYLHNNKIKYIYLWDNKEFSDPEDFLDDTHLKEGEKINKILAKEIVDQGILK